eukprot:CAMPEP_0117663448 /NCGR_PEP_ID=MMETSP0804-20121206/8612_1 /TAXON_ID=1074897 /ORGANISM="Tetraselmis astigmatica, Strain CCMP880" /LENGTH=71 /DNA_ID=CAMNT_0005470455 /DNA_START=66 /DNA_END=277 /DNA_ORIENTATION=-
MGERDRDADILKVDADAGACNECKDICHELLTSFGTSVLHKQIVAGGSYSAAESSLTSVDDADLPSPGLRP